MSKIAWLEVALSCSPTESSPLEVHLENLGYRGWVDESTHERTCYRVYLAQEPGWEERLGQLERTANHLGGAATTGAELRDEDWAENWKRFYHPLEVGKRLVVCPSWEKFAARPDQLVMVLDPGSAFGTGYHASTQLCLALLEDALDGQPTADLSMLDWGTGSGILAIAAWLLGVREIVAIDNDPVAVKVASENLELNGMPMPALLGAEPATAGFDLITANLIAVTLIELAPSIFDSLKNGGTLVAGGIIDTRRDDVIGALQDAGLELIEARASAEWVALRMRKP